MDNFQTIAALTIVGLTVSIFLFRFFYKMKKRKDGCGGSCNCSVKPDFTGKTD